MKPPNGAPPTVPLTFLGAAIKHAWQSRPRDGMILEMILETAIRNRECRLLLVRDVWRAGDVVDTLIIRPEIAKGGKRRSIPLSGPFRDKLKRYILKERSGPDGPRYLDPLFPSIKTGESLSRRGMVRVVSSHLKAVGSEGTPHWIRHTAATELLRVSNARLVQMILGHSRLETVQIYTHPTLDDLREAQEQRLHRSPAIRELQKDLENADDPFSVRKNRGDDGSSAVE